jgi:hypothetical protein
MQSVLITTKVVSSNHDHGLPSGVKITLKIAIFRMCYGENGTVKFLETLADNVFSHRYSMMQI